jgi:hypothetical protein
VRAENRSDLSLRRLRIRMPSKPTDVKVA